MNSVKEKIEFLKQELEGAKRAKTLHLRMGKDVDRDIKAIEEMISDYENISNKTESDDLLNAVKTIKNYCDTQDQCENCPLGRVNGDCILIEQCPGDWVFNDSSKILI